MRIGSCITYGLFAAACAVLTPAAEYEIDSTYVTEEGCTVERFRIRSAAMGRDIRTVVVLPPAYVQDTEKKFPVLHTLHGMDAPYDTWAQMSTLRRTICDKPMIITCFDADKASKYIDADLVPESQFTTFFFKEFVPVINARYRTDPARRGVTGFSMGGFGAMHYMLEQPGLFNSVSGLSGAYYSLMDTTVVYQKTMVPLVGTLAENRKAYERYDLLLRLDAAAESGMHLPPMYIHCGTEDFFIEIDRSMRDFLNEKGFACEYRESPGAHNWAFWKDAAPGVVAFHWKHFAAEGTAR